MQHLPCGVGMLVPNREKIVYTKLSPKGGDIIERWRKVEFRAPTTSSRLMELVVNYETTR